LASGTCCERGCATSQEAQPSVQVTMSDCNAQPAKLPSSAAWASPDLPELAKAIRARTPARILVGRAGPAYRTATQLDLRQDHAAALDAVHAELALLQDFGREVVERWKLFEIRSQAVGKTQKLLRTNTGRRCHDS